VAAVVVAIKSWRAAERAATAAEDAAKATKEAAEAGKEAAEANKTMAVEAERLRREQSQPYVVVFAEQIPATRYVLDLVIKNFGSTAAHDIRVEIKPTPQRASVDDHMKRDVWWPAEIPVLVPQQEWRTRWDLAHVRQDSGLDDRHDAVVTFTDSQGHGPDGAPGRFSYQFVLDWAMYWGQVGMGEPDIARNIESGLGDVVKSINRLTAATEQHPPLPHIEPPPPDEQAPQP
jgi:hypothetical protein